MCTLPYVFVDFYDSVKKTHGKTTHLKQKEREIENAENLIMNMTKYIISVSQKCANYFVFFLFAEKLMCKKVLELLKTCF